MIHLYFIGHIIDPVTLVDGNKLGVKTMKKEAISEANISLNETGKRKIGFRTIRTKSKYRKSCSTLLRDVMY